MTRNIESATVIFEKDMFNWIEERRGSVGRSAFVRGILRAEMNRVKSVKKEGKR